MQERAEESIKALTSLQVFWAAANLSSVQKVTELSCSNTSLDRASAMVLSGPEMYLMSDVSSDTYASWRVCQGDQGSPFLRSAWDSRRWSERTEKVRLESRWWKCQTAKKMLSNSRSNTK